MFYSIFSYRTMFGYQLFAFLPVIYAVNCAVNVSIIVALTAERRKRKKKKTRYGRWKSLHTATENNVSIT